MPRKLSANRFVEAAMNGDLVLIENYLAQGIDPNCRDKAGRGALDIAVLMDQNEVVKRLLSAGVNPDEVGYDGHTPLHSAALMKSLAMVDALLAGGADINRAVASEQREFQGRTVLICACLRPNNILESVKRLLIAGADARARDLRGFTPLMHLVDRVSYRRAAQILAPNRAGTAIKDLIDLIRSNVDEANRLTDDPALIAAQLLIDAGTDPLAQDNFGMTAMMLAQKYNYQSMIELLAHYQAVKAAPDEINEAAERANRSLHARAGTFWQLRDDSEFEVLTDPWPPIADTPIELIAKAGRAYDDNFAGSVEYRISAAQENSEEWLPMTGTGLTKRLQVRFQNSITLAKGKSYIQFRVKPDWLDQANELLDWYVEIS